MLIENSSTCFLKLNLRCCVDSKPDAMVTVLDCNPINAFGNQPLNLLEDHLDLGRASLQFGGNVKLRGDSMFSPACKIEVDL